jgi:hypothetical protein
LGAWAATPLPISSADVTAPDIIGWNAASSAAAGASHRDAEPRRPDRRLEVD